VSPFPVCLAIFSSLPSLGWRTLRAAGIAATILGAGLTRAAGAAQPLVFLGDRDLAPYEFLADGQPRGANVDLALAIGRVLGRPVEVRLQEWGTAQAAFLEGQGHALTMLGRTPERERHHVFSQPTMPVSFALFVRADEAPRLGATPDLKGLRVGVTSAGLPREYLREQHPEAVLVPVENLADGTQRLLRREIDAFAAQEWSEYFLLSEQGADGIVGLPPFSVRRGNIAFRKADLLLAREVDGALTSLMESGEFDRIISNWSYTKVHLLRQSTLNAALAGAAAVLLALIALGVALVVVARQRSALTLAKEALETEHRRKDAFLALLAHELRNPLAPISNVTRLLQKRGDGSAEAQRAYAVLGRQVNHLTHLVDDLLDVNRINTGKLELRKELLDLNAVMHDAIEVAQPLLDAGQHRLVLDLHPQPLWIEADRVRVSQIVSNLLNNAAKYTPNGGDVGLSTLQQDGSAVIRVWDHGVGIQRDRLGRIFDMFYQEERSLDRAAGGLGIGLWLTRGLVTMRGGTIEAFSDGDARGSLFTVRLPLSTAAPAPRDAGPSTISAARRILVVDDNADSAESLSMLLESMGHQAETALGGAEGLAQGERLRPDLVFLDLGMPGMDGLEVCRRLRATDWGRAAMVVALTGWGAESDQEATRRAGFDAHLTKPVDIASLEAIVGSGAAEAFVQ
jgi:signal transduction histidine kinase/ActR/RegA family two-component response regulator